MPPNKFLKIISLNIERNNHYGRFLPFLKKEAPVIVCLQEVLDHDVERFDKELGIKGFFVPTVVANKGPGAAALAKQYIKSGQGIWTSLPLENSGAIHYCGCEASARVTLESKHFHRILVWARLRVGGKPLTVLTTHFTWTPDGQPSGEQRQDMERFLEVLKAFPEFVLSGDFNAPRGGEIWKKLAAVYTDNIPPQYKSSLDPDLHRKKGLVYMVDGLFTTPHVRASNTRLVGGVSDHMAIVSEVEPVSLKSPLLRH